MTLSDYLLKQYSPTTAHRYHREISHYLRHHPQAETYLYTQVVEVLGNYRTRRSARTGKPMSFGAIRTFLCALQQYYAYLIATGRRADNPATSIQLKDTTSRDIQLQHLLSPEELERLLHQPERYSILHNRNHMAIGFMIYQGLTQGELKRLTIGDINVKHATIRIQQSRTLNGRTLPLEPVQLYPIIQYLEIDRPKLLAHSGLDTAVLMISKLGTPETGEGYSYLVERCKHLFPNRTLSVRTIRQSVIANKLRAGIDVRIVQEFAGHKTVSSTEKYQQSQVEELKTEILKKHPLG